jgi:hypothetical protein
VPKFEQFREVPIRYRIDHRSSSFGLTITSSNRLSDGHSNRGLSLETSKAGDSAGSGLAAAQADLNCRLLLISLLESVEVAAFEYLWHLIRIHNQREVDLASTWKRRLGSANTVKQPDVLRLHLSDMQ